MNEEIDELFEDTYDVISMDLDNGETLECFVIDGVLVDNIQYLLVVDCENFDDEEAEAFILKQIGEEGEDAIYSTVEDDNEYNKILVLLQENETDYEMKF